ncbi:MAG: hypothetical protein AAFR31_15905 [Cyanobacteria bacterium J06627_8]
MRLLISPTLAVVSTAAFAFPAFALEGHRAEPLHETLTYHLLYPVELELSTETDALSSRQEHEQLSDSLRTKVSEGEGATLHARFEEEAAK